MRVLAACERSGKVRDAFRRLGHEAYSCDLRTSAGEFTQFHYQEDVNLLIAREAAWDLIIMFPECRYMATSGNHVHADTERRSSAVRNTVSLWKLAKTKSKLVCLENPRSVIFQFLAGDLQWIHPWMFGHPEKKETGLLLHNLPRLQPTRDVFEEMQLLPRKVRERVLMVGEKNRRTLRAETYDGVAQAMASQWGVL